MAGRERMKLTNATIARLRPREREYTVWDSRMPGLGVRVRPSGGRSYTIGRGLELIGPFSGSDGGNARRL